MRWHLPAPGAGIILCSSCREQRFQRGYAKQEAKRPIAVIRINPIDARAKKKPHGGCNGFMPGAGDLKEDFALPLQLDFAVVQPPQQLPPAAGSTQGVMIEAVDFGG